MAKPLWHRRQGRQWGDEQRRRAADNLLWAATGRFTEAPVVTRANRTAPSPRRTMTWPGVAPPIKARWRSTGKSTGSTSLSCMNPNTTAARLPWLQRVIRLANQDHWNREGRGVRDRGRVCGHL